MADLAITPEDIIAPSSARVWLGVAGEPITPGKAVYEDLAANRWHLADTEAAALAERVGIALTTSAVGQPVSVARRGSIYMGGVLTPGSAYFVSQTAGGICLGDDLEGVEDRHLLGLASSDSLLGLHVPSPLAFGDLFAPPFGFLFLVDADGVFLIDGDGAFLLEAA